MSLPKVKIRNGEHGHTEVYLNDNKVKLVESVKFEHESGFLPICELHTFGFPDIEIENCVVDIYATPTDLSEASRIIQRYYENSEFFREAVISSAIGVLKEHKGEESTIDVVANMICDRIFGID